MNNHSIIILLLKKNLGITEIVMRLWPEKKLPPKPEPGPEEKNVKEGRRGKKKKKK